MNVHRLHRLPGLAVLLATFTLFGCADRESPAAPSDAPAPFMPAPSLAIVDGSSGGNPGVRFRIPISVNKRLPGTFDPDVPLRMSIELLGGGGEAETFSVADGDIRVRERIRTYSLLWRVPDGAEPGDVYRVTLLAGGVELGAFADLQIARNFRDALHIVLAGENAPVLARQRIMPITVYLNTEALPWALQEAEEALQEETGGLDADLQVVQNNAGAVLQVNDPENPGLPVAGILTVEEGSVQDDQGNPVDDYVVSLVLLPKTAKATPLIPASQQFPNILEGNITGLDGQPLRFAEGQGASVVICQPVDMETNTGADYFLPELQTEEQVIIKVSDDGTIEVLETQQGAPECEGYDESEFGFRPGESRLGGLARMARAGARRVVRAIVAEPLRAGHGGLTSISTIGLLSKLQGALLTRPDASEADVPATVGAGDTVALTVRAQVTPTVPQVEGGDIVEAAVSGANSGPLPVTDNDDGTYTVDYTPLNAGSDQIAITVQDPVSGVAEPIAGSPFTVQVTGSVQVNVTDPSGAPIAGADVTVTDPATGVSSSALTDAGGTALFDGLSAASYTADATAVGFAPTSESFDIGTPGQVSLALQLTPLTGTVVMAGPGTTLAPGAGGWAWDGIYLQAFRTAVADPANFGLAGTAPQTINTLTLSTLQASDLSGVDVFVSTWWPETESAPFHATVEAFFLGGGSLLLLQDPDDRDGIGGLLGVPTSLSSLDGQTNQPATGGAPLFDGPFGQADGASLDARIGELAEADITAAGGTAVGWNAAGEVVAAVWAPGEYAPGAGAMVILTDIDLISTFQTPASYDPLNAGGRLGLNIAAFLAEAVILSR